MARGLGFAGESAGARVNGQRPRSRSALIEFTRWTRTFACLIASSVQVFRAPDTTLGFGGGGGDGGFGASAMASSEPDVEPVKLAGGGARAGGRIAATRR